MDKNKFFKELKKELLAINYADSESLIEYYKEIINDLVDSGKCEIDAVAELGSPKEIAQRAMEESGGEQVKSAVKADKKQKCFYRDENGKFKTMWLVLIIVGSPLWFSIGCGVLGVGIGVICAIFSLVIALYATVSACALSGIVVFGYGIVGMFENVGFGLMVMGGGLIAFALGIVGFIYLTKFIKQCFSCLKSKKYKEMKG